MSDNPKPINPPLTKIDIKKLRERHPPLAKVVETLAMSATARDSDQDLAGDIALLVHAHQSGPALKQALDELGYYKGTKDEIATEINKELKE